MLDVAIVLAAISVVVTIKATLEAAKVHSHYKTPLKDNQGRGVACGFWFNFGGNTCVSLNINFDGTVGIVEGNPDIGGSRSSISQIAAEELGISLEKVKTIIVPRHINRIKDIYFVMNNMGLKTQINNEMELKMYFSKNVFFKREK